jgi:hypothetical protein
LSALLISSRHGVERMWRGPAVTRFARERLAVDRWTAASRQVHDGDDQFADESGRV